MESTTDETTIREALNAPQAHFAATGQLIAAAQGQARAVICEQVDERINRLEDDIKALKSHRNMTAASTSGLPNEVLSIIFLAYRNASARDDRNDLLPRSWIRITHICRHWRAVALNNAALWSYLTFNCKVALTELMLSRSKKMQLSVSLKTSSKNETLRKILLLPDRLLSVDIKSWDVGTLLNDNEILRSARTLESLRIHQAGPLFGSHKLQIRKDVLEGLGGCSALKRLEIVGCDLSSWGSVPALPGLTNLKLHNTSDSEHRPLPIPSMVSLAAMRCLKVLDLSDFLPHTIQAQPSNIVTSLPALQSLTLQGTIAEIRDFLRETHIPISARIFVALKDRNLNFESIDSCLAALRGAWIQLQSDKYMGVQEVRLEGFNPSQYGCPTSFLCWLENPLEKSSTLPDSSAHLTVKFTYQPRCDVAGILTAINELLDLSSLGCLKFNCAGKLDKGGWINLLARLPHLETLAFRNTCIWPFLAVLKEDPVKLSAVRRLPKLKAKGMATTTGKQSSAGSHKARPTTTSKAQPTPFFPALQTIQLRAVDFDENLSRNSKVAQDLADALGRRPKPYAVEKVELDLCINFSDHDCSFLRCVVPDVKWDGIVDKIQDSEEEEMEEDDYICDCCR